MTRSLCVIMFFLANAGLNLAFDNNEQAWKILLYQMIAVIGFAATHWLTEDKP